MGGGEERLCPGCSLWGGWGTRCESRQGSCLSVKKPHLQSCPRSINKLGCPQAQQQCLLLHPTHHHPFLQGCHFHLPGRAPLLCDRQAFSRWVFFSVTTLLCCERNSCLITQEEPPLNSGGALPRKRWQPWKVAWLLSFSYQRAHNRSP